MPLDKKIKKRIAFLVQLPIRVSPGQRFRFENWIPYLEQNGFSVKLFPFIDSSTYKILYQPGYIFQKVYGTLQGFTKRIALLFALQQFDFIFLQREAAPVGPPLLEWIMIKLLKKKIIYDFDDAIWMPPYNNKLFAFIKCYWKVAFICRWAYKISVGNEYLANFANQHNSRVIIVPTVVDTIMQHNRVKTFDIPTRVVIGWTGSHSTIDYLTLVESVLQQLYLQVPFTFIAIADRNPGLDLPDFLFIKWKEQTEIDDLLKFDIGIMPLTDDPWSSGKCGFKLIQYLSLGIPAVASPVGVNKNIIQQAKNGFLCNSSFEWEHALKTLLTHHQMRKVMGQEGRNTVENFYSIESQKEKFLALFN